MFKKLLTILAVVSLAVVSSFNAYAVPVEMTFTSTVSSSSETLATVGSDVSIVILADNGSASLSNQTWTIADLISATVNAGTYEMTMTDGWFSSDTHIAFATDALADITLSNFYGSTSSVNHTDSYGVGSPIYMFNTGITTYAGTNMYFSPSFADTSAWSVAFAEEVTVSEPATLALMGLGLLGFGATRRKIKK